MPPMSTRPIARAPLPWAEGLLRELSSRRVLRPLAIWALILAAGVLLIYGRYDWGAGGGIYAKRGFYLSSYVFLIMLPTTYYLLKWVLRNVVAARVLTTTT
jgi:hypothetical protein